MEFDLTIGITSYNRVNELARCLESIDIKNYSVEILVSEDKSPKKEEIKKVVNEFADHSNYEVVFHSNEKNLGYDRNLGNIIKMAHGKYILFMSDDDCFNPGVLDEFINEVISKKVDLGYAAFDLGLNREVHRFYNESFIIPKGKESIYKYFNDAILFSGLMFKKEAIIHYDAERFLNHYYFQVYLFMNVMINSGAYYVSSKVVWSVCDGENAYGNSESSEKKEELSNRESIFSNIEFNKGLIKVIKIFDKENNTDVITAYQKEYSFKSYFGLSKAKKEGKEQFKEYWKRLKSLDIKLNGYAYIYKFMLDVLGYNISDRLMIYFRTITMKRIQKRHE